MTLENMLRNIPTRPEAKVDVIDIKNGNYTEVLIVKSPNGNLTGLLFDEKGKFTRAFMQDKNGKSHGNFDMKDGKLCYVSETGQRLKPSHGDFYNIDFGWEDSKGYPNKLKAFFLDGANHNGFRFEFNENVCIDYKGRSDSLDVYSRRRHGRHYELNVRQLQFGNNNEKSEEKQDIIRKCLSDTRDV